MKIGRIMKRSPRATWLTRVIMGLNCGGTLYHQSISGFCLVRASNTLKSVAGSCATAGRHKLTTMQKSNPIFFTVSPFTAKFRKPVLTGRFSLKNQAGTGRPGFPPSLPSSPHLIPEDDLRHALVLPAAGSRRFPAGFPVDFIPFYRYIF